MTICLMEYHISGIQCIGKLFELNLHFNKTCQWQVCFFNFDKETDSRYGQHNKKAYEGPFITAFRTNMTKKSKSFGATFVVYLIQELLFRWELFCNNAKNFQSCDSKNSTFTSVFAILHLHKKQSKIDNAESYLMWDFSWMAPAGILASSWSLFSHSSVYFDKVWNTFLEEVNNCVVSLDIVCVLWFSCFH